MLARNNQKGPFNMKKLLSFISIIGLMLALTACGPDGQLTTGDVSAVTGGILGGVIGHQIGGGSGRTAATIAGAVIGSAVGRQFGRRLDAASQRQNSYAAQRALNTGQATSWRGHHARGTVIPGRAYRGRYHNRCRAYRNRVYIEGQGWQTATGRACWHRGRWRIVN